MRKKLVKHQQCLCTAVITLAVGAGILWGGVSGTPHDFSGAGWSKGEMCLPCHSNHRNNQEQYAWNHALPADTDFTKRQGATLGLESLMCLGCHDGQTALDSFGGVTGSIVLTGAKVVGRDLSNDHPVGVAYPSGDSRYKNQGSVESTLPLYDGKIECGSCHDAHDNTSGNFLRISTRQLCQTCHDY